MSNYRIACLPGDGIGKDVMDAAMVVLKRIDIGAEYIYGDVGWEFWKSEGNPLPERTVELLKSTDCCLFGAITSKPKDDAEKELAPKLKSKGFSYIPPTLLFRQGFKLHTNFRPCKSYKGNPMQYRDGIQYSVRTRKGSTAVLSTTRYLGN